MMTDLTQLVARHRPVPEWLPDDIQRQPRLICQGCQQSWGERGCDASQLAAALAVEAVARSWAEQQLAAEQAARARERAALESIAKMPCLTDAKIPCLSDLLGEFYEGEEACGCACCRAQAALEGEDRE